MSCILLLQYPLDLGQRVLLARHLARTCSTEAVTLARAIDFEAIGSFSATSSDQPRPQPDERDRKRGTRTFGY
jgi:hypothetical protein